MDVALIVLSSAIALFWLYALIVGITDKLTAPHLRVDTPTPGPFPKVSVIVPARNESANIVRCLSSLAKQDYPHYEVIVVDDRSEDDTYALCQQLAQQHPHIKVVAGQDLPDGWAGKNWANQQGVQVAEGEILVFTDADTAFHPACLRQSVQHLIDSGKQALTLAPLLECLTFWEKVYQPAQIFFLLMFSPGFLTQNPKSKASLVNGQFIMVHRPTYERLGGHPAIKGKVVDDKAIGDLYKKNGIVIGIAIATDLFRCRMYTSFGEILNGWSKNMYLGLDRKLHLLALLSLIMLCTNLLPFFFLPLSLTYGPEEIFLTSLFSVVACLVLRAISVQMYDLPSVYALTHPLAAMFAMLIFLHSGYRGLTGRGVSWKGRVLHSS